MDNNEIKLCPDVDFVPIEDFMQKKQWVLTIANFGCLLVQMSLAGLLVYQAFNESSRMSMGINMMLLVALLAMGVLVFVISKKEGRLQQKCNAVNKCATHIERCIASGRRMRRVFKDRKMGLVDEATFFLVLPIEYEEITYLGDGDYYTVTLPGGTPERYNENVGF